MNNIEIKKDTKGIIYILINEAMPDFVRIGVTQDLKQRLRTLDNTSVPLPFQCVYAIEIDDYENKEKGLLKAFSGLPNNIRSRFNREFLRLKPQPVIDFMNIYSDKKILIDINNNIGNNYFKKITDQESISDIKVQVQINERRSNFKFSDYNIQKGTELKYIDDNTITCEVADGTEIIFEGEKMSASKAIGIIKKREGSNRTSFNGFVYWSLDGEESLDAYRQGIDDMEEYD